MSKSILDLAETVWNWRKENGYISPKSVFNWHDKYKSEKEITNQFVEIKDAEKNELSSINKYEVHLSMTVHACKIEIRDNDFSVVNRLLKKLEK